MDFLEKGYDREMRRYEEIGIDLLIPYEKNARTHDDSQVEKIAQSIKEYGFINPILVDQNYEIIAGHGRLMGAKKLGLEKVPCLFVEDLTEEQKKAYIIADNRLALDAGWDFEILKDELLDLEAMDFDLSLTGFGEDELLEILEDEEEQLEVVEDDYEAELPAEPKAKLGDIYQLGNHRLMCGDSFDRASLDKLLDGCDLDMVMTDPPYDMEMGGQGCFAESMQHCKDRIDDIIRFDPYKLKFLPELTAKSYYVFTSKNGIPKYFEIFAGMNFNILTWCKTNCPPFTSGTFLPDMEYLLFFSKQGKKIWNNSLKPTEVYKKYYVTKAKQGTEDAGTDDHPTIKPMQILVDKIRISSNKGGNVLDLFGGSGSTLIACEQTGRRCYMMEYDPKYIDVIIDRWEKHTGKKAVLLNG